MPQQGMIGQELEIRITKQPDDPHGILRISLGGIPEIGYYCVYRGTKEQVIDCLGKALIAMKAMASQLKTNEPDIEPDLDKEK